MLKNLVPLIKEDEIQSLCRALSKEIKKEYKDLNPLLICSLKGASFFFNDLIQYLDFPLSVDFVFINKVSQMCQIKKDITISPKDRHVLLVEGIVDSGRKTLFLKSRIELEDPRSLKIVTLLDKPARRELAFHLDYIGKKVEDRFLVGYGMDVDEIGRNYRDIFTFVQ